MKKIAIVFYLMVITIPNICGQEQFVIQKCDDRFPIVVMERHGQPVCLRGACDKFGGDGLRDTFSIHYTIELLVIESSLGQTVLQVDSVSYKSDHCSNLDSIGDHLLCINTFMTEGAFCYCEDDVELSTDKLVFEIQLWFVPFVSHDSHSHIKGRKCNRQVNLSHRHYPHK